MGAADIVYRETLRRLGDKGSWDIEGIIEDAASRLRASGDEETLAVIDFLATTLSLERESANRKFEYLLKVIGGMVIVVEALAARSPQGQRAELLGIVNMTRELVANNERSARDDRRKREIANLVKAQLGDKTVGVVMDGTAFTWKGSSDKRRFMRDKKARVRE